MAPSTEPPVVSLLWALCTPGQWRWKCGCPRLNPLLDEGGDKGAPRDGVCGDTQDYQFVVPRHLRQGCTKGRRAWPPPVLSTYGFWFS